MGETVITTTSKNMLQVRQRVCAALIALVCVVALFFAVGCSCSSNTPSGSQSQSAPSASDKASQASAASSASAATKPSPPAEFAETRAQNKDVYAWITVPDTTVNLPILQSAIIDNYYLVHDINGSEDGPGAIYTQSVNALDFHDPVTVVYGHTFEKDGVVQESMFGDLHKFEDETFFNEHPTFTIFTPDKVLTYEVVSAYEYDDRHILNSYDFSNPEVTQGYFDYVLNPDSMNKHVREHARLVPGTDHIVQLSTCTHPPVDTARYLITGVLVDEQ